MVSQPCQHKRSAPKARAEGEGREKNGKLDSLIPMKYVWKLFTSGGTSGA